MLYMNNEEVGEKTKEITLTYNKGGLDIEILHEMLDYVIDCYNEDVEC